MAIGLGRLARAVIVCVTFMLALVSARVAVGAPGGRRPVDVLVPQPNDLQLLAFWVALGSGELAREGLEVSIVSPPTPAQAQEAFRAPNGPPIALLSGTDYERLIAERAPIVVAANLLQNEPLALVLRRDVSSRLHITSNKPLRQRLEALRSMAIGVAVPDRARLYSLFFSQQLDANTTRVEVERGSEALAALDRHSVDALFVATPTLETALVDDDAELLVDCPAGDPPNFAERLIQAVVVTRAFADAHPAEVRGLVRAIARAEHLIRFDQKGATAAVLHALPQLDPRHVARLVSVYAAAVPATPHVEARLIEREAKFYPVGGDALDLKGVNLEDFVYSTGDTFPTAGPGRPHHAHNLKAHWTIALLAAAALGFGLFFVFFDVRGRREGLEDGANVGG